jgi:putative hydrolase of the HAD superfamily
LLQRHPAGSKSGLSKVAGAVSGGQLKKVYPVTTLFLDIGGVLLTDGWDHHARKRAATNFSMDVAEMEARHHLTFETYEEGKLTLEEYLSRVIFYQERPFTRAQFRKFIYAQSKSYPDMIALISRLKAKYGLKIVVVSNEARELNLHRIRKFKLDRFVDTFISSSFVHIRKPDADIFRLALDIAQAPARQVVYIEDTPMFVQIAEGLGMRSILHTDYVSTSAQLASFGLQNDEGVTHETN